MGRRLVLFIKVPRLGLVGRTGLTCEAVMPGEQHGPMNKLEVERAATGETAPGKKFLKFCFSWH